MDFKFLYNRIRLMIAGPSDFWKQVKEENRTRKELRISFLLPLVILIGISSTLGTFIFTYNPVTMVYPLLKGLEYSLIFLLTIEFSSLLLAEITSSLLKTNTSADIYRLFIYSFTPFMLMMIITRLFSSLLFLNLAGLYGFYILWTGVGAIYGGPLNTRIRLTSLLSAGLLVFYLGTRWMLNSLVEGFYITIFG